MTTAALIEPHISKKPRLIVPVHFAGAALDLDKIRELSVAKGIPLAEDAAQLLILLSALFTTGGQLLQKISATKTAAMPSEAHFLKRVFSQPETWWAITCLVVGTLWLTVLYRIEVSKAFPFLSIGFVLVILVSRYHLKETISAARWLGVGLICSGIVLISLS